MALPASYMKVTSQCASQMKRAFYNVFYFVPSATPSYTADPMADAQAITAAVQAAYSAGMLGCLTTNSSIVGFYGEMHKAGAVYAVEVLDGNAGTIMGDELPDWVALCIQKRTASPGKSGRGRWFFGPFPEEITDENRVIAGFVPNVDTLALTWLQPITALGVPWTPMLYSPKLASLTGLTSTYADKRMASINGRKSHTLL